MFNDIYKGKRVLVTGHCGFKGGWLVYWLKRLGAEVEGFGHPPNTEPNHYTLLGGLHMEGLLADLLDKNLIAFQVAAFKPDLVIHLAAKAIVAKTFDEPQETFENNIMGAVNILEACRRCPNVKGIVMVTTDKIYENREWNYAYRENDELGGVDPYSASKVCIEQVIRCYREAFNMTIATARAGNVIGGGDWSYKRLIPDIVKATAKGEKVVIHTPGATRPFQHVLEALSGYLLLGEYILKGSGQDVSRSWNFGPDGGEMSVVDVLRVAQHIWPAIQWEFDCTPTHPHMVYLLKIDNTEAKKLLGWQPRWNMRQAVGKSIAWYKDYYENGRIGTEVNILDYTGGMLK
jgi:CDP-glucose 4,6-dehydratase